MKIAILLIFAVLGTSFAFPANPINEEELVRVGRAALPEPAHYQGQGQDRGHGGYPQLQGGSSSFAQSSAKSGAISGPHGSTSFANSQSSAGSGAYGR
ncbi:uncharacterized protein LOC105695490 isoform X1 [Orussus abietinus]|uniref:uncharacterized protein LOC105695490 isoform X1 n=1 Tax=Orussus abietinus TaxID=222816 RepID=UPI000C715A7C|nr:uncharacterized protein LOC105695490 isoform X1 [Orussus abietinus]